MSSPSTSTFEHAFYIGNYMSGILYGIELVMYFYSMRALVNLHNPMMTRRARHFFIAFSTILFLLLTIDIAVNAVWGEMMWINGREDEGGVARFIRDNIGVWYQVLGSTTVVAMIFMGDALLLYRLFIIYGSSFTVVAVPLFVYVVAFVLGILQLITAFSPGGNFFHGHTLSLGVPYYALTISLNVFVTCLICVRLHRLGKAVSRLLGRENASMYTSATSIFIESAAPYSAMGVAFLIPYAMGNQSAIAFGQVWAKLTCIAPQLIILRIAAGRAWAREVVSRAESHIELDSRAARGLSNGVEIHTHISIDADPRGPIHSSPSGTKFGVVTADAMSVSLGGKRSSARVSAGHIVGVGVVGVGVGAGVINVGRGDHHAGSEVNVDYSADVEKWADDRNSYSSFSKTPEAY